MENFVYKVTGKLFGLIIAGAILWIVIQMGLSGVASIYNTLSGQKFQETVFKDYSKYLTNEMNKQELEDDEILKITDHYNRKANNKFKEIGYSIILEDYYVLSMNEIETNDIFIKNKNKINKLIQILKKEEPYLNLPDKEKIVLKNLNSSIKNNDSVTIKDNLQDLEQVLEQRYAEYKRIDIESEKNLLISYISIAITIFIGILSIISPSISINRIIQFFKKER
ncbi:hypothetical protein ACN2EP_06595 [Aliarcobacter butzleri]|uniref:hypothetical protein n=1 Tax=Aliarcobacter butzleri TaxID=28197 RepID=UPI003AFA6591